MSNYEGKGVIEEAEAVGIVTNKGVICSDCLDKEEQWEVEEGESVTQEEIEGRGQPYFCGRCGKELS